MAAFNSSKSSFWKQYKPWLDVLAIFSWGVLLIKFWLTEELTLLIHPNYFGLTVLGGFGLVSVAGFKAWQMSPLGQSKNSRQLKQNPGMQHLGSSGQGWSSTVFLVAALVGFLIKPTVFASDKAVQRQVTDFVPLAGQSQGGDLTDVTKLQPQAFNTNNKPEERSLIGWVRTLTVYPEPDAYAGQPVNVQGFVIHPPELPEDYILLSRFIITCCAADVYPVGLPMKLTQNRSAYPPDTWLEVKGVMMTEEFGARRQLTIQANTIKKIPKPDNPYDS